MTDSPSTTRIEVTDDATKVVFTDHQGLHRDLRDPGLFERIGTHKDELDDNDQSLIASLYATVDYREHTVRVASARQYETDTEHDILPTAANLAYCEAEISERDPTDAEQAPYEDAFTDCPSPVYEFTLPPLDHFRNPLDHDGFTTSLENPTELEELAETFQRKIEHAKWLKIKTSYTGARNNLDPEWNPDVDSVDAGETKGGAKQKYYTARELWEDAFDVSYQEWFSARLYVLGRTERKLDGREIVALEIVEDSENESYCQYCGCIDTAENLFTIENKIERERRVCENCAEAWSEFPDDAVAQAKDERAKQTGGQRVFHDDYE